MFAVLCLALIASAAAFPANKIFKRGDGKMLIGYRAVSAVQAGQYMDDGNTIVWHGAGNGLTQLGQGIYISFNMADWSNEFFCAIFADETAWGNVNKLFVPPFWEPPVEDDPDDEFMDDPCPQYLYFDGEADAQRPEYIAAEAGSGYTVANTVLISVINGGMNGIEQVLIPPGLAPASNPLGLSVECTSGDMPDLVYAIWDKYGTVNWRSTFANVKGTTYIPPQPPAAPSRPSLEYSKIIGNGPSIPG